MAKYFGLFPIFQGCEWYVDTSMKYEEFNIFRWLLHLLKLQSCTSDAEVLRETPKDVFVNTVLKGFVTLFLRSCVDNEDQIFSLPHDYINFMKQGSSEEVKDFYNKMVTNYSVETKMFYHPLCSGGYIKKHRKRKQNNGNVNSAFHEKNKRQGKDSEPDNQETDTASHNSSTQESNENCTNSSNAGDVCYSSEDDHDFFVDPYDRIGETLTPTSADSNNSEGGGGVYNLGATSFFSSALQFLFKGLGTHTEGFVRIEHQSLNTAVNKLISGQTLNRKDVLDSIDFSMNTFVDSNRLQHSKFTDMKSPTEQNVGEVITHILLKYCTKICLLKKVQNNVETMPYLEIEPSIHGDLRSAILFEVGNSNYNLQLQNGSLFFIVHINRMKSNINNLTNFINTEAIVLPVCDDKGATYNIYGVLQSYIVTTGKAIPFHTFPLFCIIDVIYLTAPSYSTRYTKL
jgi:hypothetical protein